MSEAYKWELGQASQHKADKGPEILCNHGTTDRERWRETTRERYEVRSRKTKKDKRDRKEEKK